uniref:Box C/D snoRNA protein 1 n=1 Tax=Sphenodon punctatus TaxID=8508 RepID=A0A8D0HMG7_SPHPU
HSREPQGTHPHPPPGRLRELPCETCSKEEAKYRCPRCMKYSCSLVCVKKHKTALSCNGVREKAAFVSIGEFSDLNLLSDYRFLEDAGRLVEGIARDISLRRPRTNKCIRFLKNRARKHNIQLRTLPFGFTKRRENSTFFNIKKRKIFWHLKLMFPHSNAEFTLKRVPDDKILDDILKPYINSEESDPVIRQRLKIYTMSPQSDVQVLMKMESREHSSSSKSLRDNLKYKVVIEYPTLHVVLRKFKNDIALLGQGKYKCISSHARLKLLFIELSYLRLITARNVLHGLYWLLKYCQKTNLLRIFRMLSFNFVMFIV